MAPRFKMQGNPPPFPLRSNQTKDTISFEQGSFEGLVGVSQPDGHFPTRYGNMGRIKLTLVRSTDGRERAKESESPLTEARRRTRRGRGQGRVWERTHLFLPSPSCNPKNEARRRVIQVIQCPSQAKVRESAGVNGSAPPRPDILKLVH